MLHQAETIGIFSSSYPITAIAPEAAENAVHYLEQCGYSIKKGKLFGKMDFYRSGSIRERAEEFNELLYDPEVAVWCPILFCLILIMIFSRRIRKKLSGFPMSLPFY